MSEQSTFPRELMRIHPHIVQLLAHGIKTGAGELWRRNGYWPPFAYVEITDLETQRNVMFTFFLVSKGGWLFYESLFKVQFPDSAEFVVITVDQHRGDHCNRLQ